MDVFRDARLLASILIPVVCAATPPAPLVMPPSQYWDGDGDIWSSFALRIGTPAQDVRVLVSTNSPVVMAVAPEGCTTQAVKPVPVDCANSRGELFNSSQSSTWIDQGFFGINADGIGFEANLGYSVNADYGLETVGLGFSGGSADDVTLENQTVARIAEVSPFYTGVLGLNTQPVNYTTIGNYSAPSFFTSLKSQQLIPSLSWSYTAGAKYRLKDGSLAQLIFGGYDNSRFTSNSANFALANDIDRDIVVGIQSITYSGTTQKDLLPKPKYAFIESTDINIWLPAEACREFESAFGMSIDNSTGLYLIKATQYSQLQAADPQVTFTLGDTLSGGETVRIVLPLEALVLSTASPLGPSPAPYYFPLKTAANDTQITLGRTFLQEAYLTVDYERGNFSVSQCLWMDGVTPQYKTIDTLRDATPKSKKLTTGAIVGIVIGAVILVAVISGLAYYFVRRARGHRHQPVSTTPPAEGVSYISPAPPASTVSPGLSPFTDPRESQKVLPTGLHPHEASSTEIFQLPDRHDNREGNYLEVADRIQSNRTRTYGGHQYSYELAGSGPEPQEMDEQSSQGRTTPTGQGSLSPNSTSGVSRNTSGRYLPDSSNGSSRGSTLSFLHS